MSVTIRPASANDVKQMQQLYDEYMETDIQRDSTLRQAIASNDSEILVAEAQGKLVGLIHQVFYVDPLHSGTCSSLLFLYVAEAFRRQRIGSTLLDKALESAAKRSVREVHVSTRSDNFAAMRLYDKFRFEYAGPLFECTPSESVD
jgi:ribosomal protein S18 acetylase RimI-like enzyme